LDIETSTTAPQSPVMPEDRAMHEILDKAVATQGEADYAYEWQSDNQSLAAHIRCRVDQQRFRLRHSGRAGRPYHGSVYGNREQPDSNDPIRVHASWCG
jgi:hypothetical protein